MENFKWNKSSIGKFADTVIHWLEMIISLYLFLLVIIGLYSLTKLLIPNDGHPLFEHFHKDFESFLSNILLLIVGLELAMLLLKHRIESIIDIMMFIIARKLAVHTYQIYELGLGVLAISALFATRRYLMLCTECTKFLELKDTLENKKHIDLDNKP